MNKKEIADKAFENLPHVNKVWVTEDGHYHLHSHGGGELFERGVEVVEKKSIKAAKK